MKRKNKSGTIGVVITIIILITLVIISNKGINKLTPMESILNTIVMPVQNALTHLKNKTSKNDLFFANIETLETENKNLRTENENLKKSLQEAEIIRTENNELKKYLNLTEKYNEFKTIPADVINKDISNFTNIIIINIGMDNGIEKGMTVIGEKGLVGYVVSVTNKTAKVQTIIDAGSSIAGTISTTRESLSIKGDLKLGDKLKGVYIPTEAQVVIGDSVETSGIGGIYKKGIHIGKIESVVNTRNITDRYVVIIPAVEFTKLETVLVIIE